VTILILWSLAHYAVQVRAVAQRLDVRDVILDAADKLLATKGYGGMTMDALALEVGIGKGTLYLHFKSKEEVALSRVDRLNFRLIDRLAAIAHSTRPLDDKIRRMLVLRVLYRFDEVQRYRVSLDELFAAIRPALLIRREQHFASEMRIFADVVAFGVNNKRFISDDPMRTAESIVLCTNALLPLTLPCKDFGRRTHVARQVNAIASLVLTGLRAPMSSSASSPSAASRKQLP
jgi:AcrR family transcriptional regulator